MRTDAHPPPPGAASAGPSTGSGEPPVAATANGERASDDGRRHDDPAPTGRRLALAAGALLLIGSLAVVVVNATKTSSARVTASTSGDGFLGAGDVVLDKADSSVELFLSADGLFPGREVRGCAVIDYSGTVPATIRIFGDPGAGTGLDAFVDVRLVGHPGADCPAPETSDASGTPSGRDVYDGPVAGLWTDHSSWADGLTIVEAMAPGDRLAIEAIAVVVDDDAAQGLTTDFSLTVEGRPT